MFEPIEGVAFSRRHQDLIKEVREIQSRRRRHVRPVRRGQIGVLLQREVHGGNGPRHKVAVPTLVMLKFGVGVDCEV